MHVTLERRSARCRRRSSGRVSGRRALSAFGHDDDGAGQPRRHNGRTLLQSTLAPTVLSDLHDPWRDARRRALGAATAARSGCATTGACRLSVRGPSSRPWATRARSPRSRRASTAARTRQRAVATTASAPLSQQGNGTIRDRITLPAKCLAPIILVHPNGSDAAYIAATGSEATRPTRRRFEQDDRVHRERDREPDRPAVQVALDERAAAERALAGADAEGAGQARVLARVHEHQEDQARPQMATWTTEKSSSIAGGC